MAFDPYGQTIWSMLVSAIGNEYGVAGLMGNLYAESGLIPYRKQGDYTGYPYQPSLDYTNAVKNGTKSEYTFVHDSIGYGLAQWTYYSRKQAYFNYVGQANIGDLTPTVNFLVHELQTSFPSVWSVLVNTPDIKTASDVVLHDFENPKDQSAAVEHARWQYGVSIYNAFSGSQPVPPTPPDPPIPPTPPAPTVEVHNMPLYMYPLLNHQI